MKPSPDAAFVALCTREAELASASTLATAARSVHDWSTVATLAIRHRLAGYVLRSAARAGIELPAAALGLLQAETITTQALTLLLDTELKRLVGALSVEQVPVLVLKGPALVRTIYPEPELRPYADLDLTVHEHHEARATTALLNCGYTELIKETSAGQRARGGHHHQAGSLHRLFAGAGERALVELHLDPLQLGIKPVCEEARWSRARPLPGVPGARMLAPEDQVVQLSVHAHKHGFNRLTWLKDLDLLLRTHGASLAWDLTREVARQEGVEASVWYALDRTRCWPRRSRTP